MGTLIRSALVALVLLGGASAAMARPAPRDPGFTDTTDPTGGYAPNSPKGERAFWDYMERWGK